MNEVFPSLEVWARVTLAITWQLAALALLAVACERLLRLRHSRVRHGLWWLVLAAPLVLAPARLCLDRHRVALQVPRPVVEVVEAALAPGLSTSASAPASHVAPSSSRAAGPRSPLEIRTLFFLLWLVCCALLLLRLAAGHVCAWRLIARSAPVQQPRALEVLYRLQRDARLRRPIALRTSAHLPSVVLYGLFRPVILLPEAWLADLEESDLRSLLAHELAHIRRRDVLANSAQRLLEALLFFHPGAWAASRRIALAREELCDDWALRQTSTRSRYARALALAAERARLRLAPATLGLAEDRFTLLRRVEVIMREEGVRKVGRMTLGVLSAALLLAIAVLVAVQIGGGPAAAQGGGGNAAVSEGGGGGGGNAVASEGGGGGGNGGGGNGAVSAGGGGSGGDPAPAESRKFTLDQLDQKQLRHYQVGKQLADFPDKEDLSTPEAALATIVRTMVRGDTARWRRISPPRPERGGGVTSLQPFSPEKTRLYLGMTVQEVWIYRNQRAAVISAYPPLQPGAKSYGENVRFLVHQGNQWFNLGESAGRDLASIRSDVARSFLWMDREPVLEAEALARAWEHPERYTAEAKQLFEALRRVDYAAYLTSTAPDKWQPLLASLDYMVESDYPSWGNWVCTTFGRTPITKVQLGAVLKDAEGRPSVPYTLTLQDSTTLSGVLRFTLTLGWDGAAWSTGPGLDWHLKDKTG